MSTYIIMALLLSSWGMTPVALATEVEDTGLEENTSFGNNELTEDQMATTDTSQSEEGSDEKAMCVNLRWKILVLRKSSYKELCLPIFTMVIGELPQ